MSSLQSISPTTLCFDKSSNNESIDYDFYDSNFESGGNETDSDFEEIKEGVKGIQMKPLVKHSKDTEIKNDNCFTDKDYDSNLTKCIAYENKESNCSEIGCISKSSSEEESGVTPVVSPTTISSLSTSSPSDLTNITPFSSSSSCSSMKDKNEDNYHSDYEEESSKLEMKLLADAVESLSINKKNTRSPTHSILSRNFCGRPRRKNMTFTNEQLRKIDRENEILLKKIMSYTKPRPKQIALATNTTPVQIKSSAAVNRTKQQRQINHDNYILLKKIHNAKSTQSFINKN